MIKTKSSAWKEATKVQPAVRQKENRASLLNVNQSCAAALRKRNSKRFRETKRCFTNSLQKRGI